MFSLLQWHGLCNTYQRANMYVQTRKDGAEQAVALLSGDPQENQSHSHSAWLLLKVLICTLSFLMLALSQVLCVVYRHQYGEQKVQNMQIEEHSIDQFGGSNRPVSANQPQSIGAVIAPGTVEMFSSQTHVSMPNSAVLNAIPKESRRKSHTRTRAKMSSFLRIVEDLLHEDLLKLHQKILCLDAHADKEVVALRARGFKHAQGINFLPALLTSKHTHENFQIMKLGDQNYDFIFTSMFDRIPYPALFVAEIERTLKVGGLAAMHVSLNKWRNKYITGEPGRSIKPVTLLFQHSEIVYVSSASAPGLDTIIVFKKTLHAKAIQVDQKETKKKQLHDNPARPQSDVEPVKLSSNHKCRKYAEEGQLRSGRYVAKVQATTGSLLYTSMRGTFLPSATRLRGETVLKKSMPAGLPEASNLNPLFIQGLSTVAQLNRAIVQDSFSASKMREKALGDAKDNIAVES